ncbi:MAG: prepilin-type N-terminal cleavage/methylation domain-containing protein [Deltaproteobacteria bacterium]|nr:prepilin-type N-terminal cleavage/methylation domain-containing protein [Deltaproteobacteria bacterium]
MSKTGQSGFTLLEVLVALVVLSVGLLGMAALTVGIIDGNLYSKNVTTATVIAEARLEDIRRAGYVAATPGTVGPDSVSMGGASFARLTSITDNTPLVGNRTVAVTVSWGGGTHSVTLNTILARNVM